MARSALFAVTIAAACAGCTQFPELDGVVPASEANAPYPDLVPLQPIITRANGVQSNAATVASDLSGRIAALRARAAGLRGPVIPAPEKARMLRGPR